MGPSGKEQVKKKVKRFFENSHTTSTQRPLCWWRPQRVNWRVIFSHQQAASCARPCHFFISSYITAASSPITSWQIDGKKNGNNKRLFFLAQKSLRTVTTAVKLKDTWKKNYDKFIQHIKNQRHHFATKVCLVKARLLQ